MLYLRAVAMTASMIFSGDAVASFGLRSRLTEFADVRVRHSFAKGRRTVLNPMPAI